MQPNKNKKTVIILVLTIVGMFGFGFAMSPLYRVFCKATGLDGRVYQAGSMQSAVPIDDTRIITVQFVGTNNEDLPWTFKPNVPTIKIHPGQVTRVSFYARNDSQDKMTVQAIPSVSPAIAAKYLHKTECFCFQQQTFTAGEEMDMPILFHLDRDIPKEVNTVTLSYTLFDVKTANTNKSRKIGKIS